MSHDLHTPARRFPLRTRALLRCWPFRFLGAAWAVAAGALVWFFVTGIEFYQARPFPWPCRRFMVLLATEPVPRMSDWPAFLSNMFLDLVRWDSRLLYDYSARRSDGRATIIDAWGNDAVRILLKAGIHSAERFEATAYYTSWGEEGVRYSYPALSEFLKELSVNEWPASLELPSFVFMMQIERLPEEEYPRRFALLYSKKKRFHFDWSGMRFRLATVDSESGERNAERLAGFIQARCRALAAERQGLPAAAPAP